MNVFESQAGHEFVSYLFPRLVDAVEKIAAKLSVAAVPPEIPVQPREDILRELFAGYFCPGDEAGSIQTAQYNNLTMTLHALEKDLRQQIGEERWKSVEQYCTTFAERDAEEMSICFETGFRAATQLIVAGLTASKTTVNTHKRLDNGGEEQG